MSATNQTPNYGLSQFIGTDVPGWLSDYNSDNTKIDTAIHAAKAAADAAATTAGQAANDITSINQTLTTQAAQISAAAQSASQAQTGAGQALNTAQTADGKADTNAAAINGLDTRVTALEGGGGGASIKYLDENYGVAPANRAIPASIASKKIISAVVLTASQTDVLAFLRYGESNALEAVTYVSGANTLNAYGKECTIRYFYID